MQAGSVSKSRGSSIAGTSTPKGTSTPSLDIYRPLANQVTKPLQSLLSTKVPSTITSLLSLRPSAYTQKVQNKALNFQPGIQDNRDEAKAVRGKKRNRGDPDAREAARQAAEAKQAETKELEIGGRAKRKRAVLDAGQEISYERVRPLHHLHTIYLSNLLNLPPHPGPNASSASTSTYTPSLTISNDMLHSKLSKADFTGASLLVTTARNPSLNGMNGLVVEETASTFRLVTPSSTVKVIPKNGTQFSITFPAYAPPPPSSSDQDEDGAYQSTVIPSSGSTMEEYLNTAPRISVPLLGTNFGFRSGDRAGRKFRPTQGGGGGSGWGETWVKGEWSEVLGLLGEEKVESRVKGGARRGESGVPVKRKRGKSRRKDPPAFGALEVS